MCGIGGFHGPVPDPDAVLSALDEALLHRGPDEGGRLQEEDVGLLIRRLSIIDLKTGSQPIASEDGEVVTVYNGEIYNHVELRSALEARGHTFRSRADTEVIVHQYEEDGDDFLHQLRGMFAIAVWDRRRRRLLLARDRLGIKPLYYSWADGHLLYASEIGALIAAGAPTDLDLDAVATFFRLGYVPAPATCFRHIRALPPGSRLVMEAGRTPEPERWWSLAAHLPEPPATIGEARERLRALLEESVKLRLLSDVPLGAFLSGGLDSTLVVGTMARLMNRPVETFTIGFDEAGYDETASSHIAATRFGVHEHVRRLDSGAVDVLDAVVAGFGQPFADPSAVPTLLVSRLAREHVTVALSGDGGDELFGGYTRYRQAGAQLWYDRVPQPVRAAAASIWPAGARGAGALAIAARSFRDRYVENAALTTSRERAALLAPELAAKSGGDPFRDAEPLVARLGEGLSSVEDLLHFDLYTYLPDDILAKVDRMSMSCSLEARVPLLDHKLVEFVFSLPLSWRMGKGGGKRLLRETFHDLYPDDIRNRGKMGFGVPLGSWLGGPLRERLTDLPRSRAVRDGLLRGGGVESLVREHLGGSRDRGRKLWALMVFDAWWEQHARRAQPVVHRNRH